MPHNGAVPMAHSFISLQHVIKVLCLASMDISAKGLMALANAFSTNWGMSIGLEEIDVSNNNSDSSATDAWVQYVSPQNQKELLLGTKKCADHRQAPTGPTCWLTFCSFLEADQL